MNWKRTSVVIALFLIATPFGCGGKPPTPTPPPTNPPNVAQNANRPPMNPVPANVAPQSQLPDDTGEGDQDPPNNGAPSPPTFGGNVSPNGQPPSSQPAPPTPPPANPGEPLSIKSKSRGPASGLPGTPSANGAGANTANAGGPPGDNPFEDPENLLPVSLSFRERAINAFQGGNVPRAYGLYQAHLLSLPDEERESEMRNVRWDKKRIAPRLGYGFAVGLVLNNTSRQENFKPIGTKSSALGATGGSSGFGGAAGGDSSSTIPTLNASELSNAAGTYASEFVDAFVEAHADGKWSEVFRDSKLKSPTTPTNGAAATTGSPPFGQSGGFGKPGAKGRQGGTQGGSRDLGAGDIQFPFRFSPQDDVGLEGFGAAPGSNNPGLSPPGAPGFGSRNAPNAPPMDPAVAKDLELPEETTPLAPGLSYIGKGDSVGELSKRASQQHYDALVVFEVEVSLLRVNNTIKNDCRIRILNLRADKESKDKAIVSASLNNRDVAIDKDPDGRVETAVENLLKKMFDAYPLDDLPNFKSESIQGRRLKDLVNDKVRNKLDLLSEVELYASKGLIDNTLRLAAFERIAGADGKDLASKEPEDRVPILEKMINRQFD